MFLTDSLADADTGTYKEADIDGKTYCFDYYGIMQLGWIKKSSTTPAIAGYNYYFDALKASASDAAGLSGVSSGSDAAAPSSSKAFASFAFGEKVESNWIRNAGPDDDEISGNNTDAYYYMDHSGFPLHAASQSYVIKEVRGDKYCFDMFGNSVTGLVKIGNGFYYCGEENGNRKCAVGRTWVADGIDSGRAEYYFDTAGKGITGNRDGKYYYLGRLQKADAGSRYELFNLPDLGKRLLDSSGKIVKGRTVKDSEGNTWVVSGSGEITTYGSESASSPIEPEATTMY